MDPRIAAMKAALRSSGRLETGPTLHRALSNPTERIHVGPEVSRAHAASIAPAGDGYAARINSDRLTGSKEDIIKALAASGLGVGGLALLPSEASAMDNMPSPKAAMANPRLAEEHPEERAARLEAEQVRNRVAGEEWRNVYNDEKPYSLSDLIHRDLGRPGVASDLAGEAFNPLNLIALSNLIGPQALSMMLMPFNSDEWKTEEDAAVARLREQGPGYLTAARPPADPEYSLAQDMPYGAELSLPDMPAYGETERPNLVAGGYRPQSRFARGGLVSLKGY